ncbi:hypothetical protein J7I98_07110 [Streptomyces sp. ISL-98]|uniref:hypothetical protein n=1 Tax=Streptomyces sp. ISL-98 TaxID=2819192 RepID=UPI001BE88117|nr:hypothetical protein [Streptomyces sp. ISL-98]MBT2505674.1 hypothetical protein [Streptomyces sp. ISL-98]
MLRSSTTIRTAVASLAALAAIGGLAASANASASGEAHAKPQAQTQAKKAPKESSLTGSAKMYRKDGQRVNFSFDAHGFAPAEPDEPDAPAGTSRGTFRFSHYTADGKQGAYAEGRIDCLLTGGPVATATGIITRSDHPSGIVGKRVGFTALDSGKRDRVGYSWAVGSIDTMKVPKCLSAAPYETVESGNFKVEHVMPENPSAK